MDKSEFIRKIDQEVDQYKISKRNNNSSFLLWFLVNYFRIDEDSAIDYICDQRNDKGIDGIYLDEEAEEIYVFQSKYSSNPDEEEGDTDLRVFIGSSVWFDNQNNIMQLGNSSANAELKSLIKRLEIFENLNKGYTKKLVYVTNRRFNKKDAIEYIGVNTETLDAWDIDRLFSNYTYNGHDELVSDKFDFTIPENPIEYKISDKVEAIIFPAKAKEIVSLKGIQDRTLFDKNVRYGIGRTRVNKAIEKTLIDKSENKNFFLYHNGVTLICSDYKKDRKKLTITDYSIVNGCQSTVILYKNNAYLNDDIKVLLRVIKISDNSKLSKNITNYTNNQNAITVRDLKSIDKFQQDIQSHFFKQFNKKILYQIKSGEDESGYSKIIPNDYAAQLITSFYLNSPYTAHQKTKIFTDNYNIIFSRNRTPTAIFILTEMYDAINKNSDKINDEGIRSYKLSKFFLIYVFRLIFDDDKLGRELISSPEDFLKTYQKTYFAAFEKLFSLIVIDFNNYIEDRRKKEAYFDYKNILRNETETSNMAKEIVSAYKKNLVHHPEDSFYKMLE